ncbi:MAG: hypothetical protein PHU95_02305 [Candidatus Thermoplasmatota archaeon]|nr:hypothetical protein [Candidatus Thermoplasmatota archaeon]MDD5778264.1 hypothetical protein [Candidatus Thermoplasmatota archaeon]
MKTWQERIEENLKWLREELEKWRDAMENLREAVEDVPGAVEVIKEAALSAKKTADAAYEVVIELQGDYHNFKGEMSRRLDELEKRKTLLQRLVEWLVGLR